MNDDPVIFKMDRGVFHDFMEDYAKLVSLVEEKKGLRPQSRTFLSILESMDSESKETVAKIAHMVRNLPNMDDRTSVSVRILPKATVIVSGRVQGHKENIRRMVESNNLGAVEILD